MQRMSHHFRTGTPRDGLTVAIHGDRNRREAGIPPVRHARAANEAAGMQIVGNHRVSIHLLRVAMPGGENLDRQVHLVDRRDDIRDFVGRTARRQVRTQAKRVLGLDHRQPWRRRQGCRTSIKHRTENGAITRFGQAAQRMLGRVRVADLPAGHGPRQLTCNAGLNEIRVGNACRAQLRRKIDRIARESRFNKQVGGPRNFFGRHRAGIKAQSRDRRNSCRNPWRLSRQPAFPSARRRNRRSCI